MRHDSRGMQVQVYFGEADHVGSKPLYQVLLEYLRSEGAAGATVARGIAGFGHASRIHSSAVLRLSEDLPVVLTWVDAPERVERLLPGLVERAGSGVVITQEIGVAAYGRRPVEHLRFDLPVQDVMTPEPAAVRDNAPVREAIALLVGTHFRSLPVVDDDGRLVGILSNSDLVERAGLGARLELIEAMSIDRREELIAAVASDLTAAAVMTREPVDIDSRQTLADATRLMSARQLKRLPVVTDSRLVGVISRGDVLRAVGEVFPRGAEGAPAVSGATVVGDLMRRDAPVVRSDADLAELLDVVVSTRLNRAVVVDEDNRVIGVVSDADVVRSLGASLPEGLVSTLMGAAGLVHPVHVTAGELVTGEPVTIQSTATLAEAARLSTEHRWKLLPVVDDAGHFVGIVDRADLLHASRDALDDAVSEGEPPHAKT
jgi:CBS domain-containing protein